MNKNQKSGLAVLGIVLVVFSVIAFVAPFEMTGTFWIAYACGVVAILMQLYFFKVAFNGDGSVKSKFYGLPIAKVGAIYLIGQLVVSLVEMILAEGIPSWVAVIINVIILAAALIGCIAADVIRAEIIGQDETIKANTTNMRALQSLTATFVGMCDDADTKKALQSLAEDFKYSDPVSSEQTMAAEEDLKFLVIEIQRALEASDYEGVKEKCSRAKNALSARNMLCKLGK